MEWPFPLEETRHRHTNSTRDRWHLGICDQGSGLAEMRSLLLLGEWGLLSNVHCREKVYIVYDYSLNGVDGLSGPDHLKYYEEVHPLYSAL